MLEEIRAKCSSPRESDLRRQRCATLLAITTCALACGVILGVALSGQRPARAGDGALPPELLPTFAEIARKVEPAVVNINTVSQPGESTLRDFSESQSPFDLLPFGRERGARRGTGSGVIIDPQGYILTNNHVVTGADRIRVKLYDGTELMAKLIGSDRETDLAVIKVESKAPLPAARLGDSDKVRVGDWVLAIGSPFGLDQTVTAGIISAKDREANVLSSRTPFQYFLQTDAAINRGNSGGPLVNLAGEVIGINTAIATGNGDYNGIGFALPSSEAVVIYNQLLKSGTVVRGFLGVVPEPVTPQIARVYGLPAARGAIISNVSETIKVGSKSIPSPAAKAGLRRNDIITEIRGERVKDHLDLIRRVAAIPVGTSVQIKFYRDGKEMAANVVVGRREDPNAAARSGELSDEKKAEGQTLGLHTATLTMQQAKQLRLNDARGVVVTQVEPGSIAEDVGLRRNDVIEMINREPVATAEQFQRALDRIKSGEPVVLQVITPSRRPDFSRSFISFDKP